MGYSSGEWWSDGSLNNLLLNASQIVISYADAQSADLPLPCPPTLRSKRDALGLVRSLRATLRADSGRFAALAREHSDEPVSAAMGGALGNFHALAMPREIVDALAQTKVGEVSRIVETTQGYHLLLRQPAVTEGKLAFAHLVIKHPAATGFRRGDRAFAEHTRDEARALAQALAARAQGAPQSFAALVQEHSEAEDALRAGDVGLWPRTELLQSEFLLYEVASRLAVGAVSGVIETASGFHVLRRTAEQERDQLAMSVINILHDQSQFQPDAAAATRSKAEAMRSARKLLAELRLRPETFAQKQRERCELAYCDGAFRFEDGRGPPALERALRQLAPGEVARQVIETPFGLVLLRREDPAGARAAAQVRPRTEFGPPDPEDGPRAAFLFDRTQ